MLRVKPLLAAAMIVSIGGGASATMQRQIDFRVLYYDTPNSEEIVGIHIQYCDGLAELHGRPAAYSSTEHYGC